MYGRDADTLSDSSDLGQVRYISLQYLTSLTNPLLTQKVRNQPFDEAVSVDGDSQDEVETPDTSESKHSYGHDDDDSDEEEEEEEEDVEIESRLEDSLEGDVRKGFSLPAKFQKAAMDEEDEEEEEEEDGEEEDRGKIPLYNPAHYAGLVVTDDIKELFTFITAYKPHEHELETRLRPFIPEYIPAIGDIDRMVKIPRPDGKPDYLGLTVLDEPAAVQSDPTVVELTMRYQARRSDGDKPHTVRSISEADKNPKAVENWISNVNNLHQSKPPPTVTYSKPMPDIEHLMQIWPQEFEDLLNEIDVPSADADLSTEDYARLLCALLDIPVYGNPVESLHVMFTLFSDFKANQHFATANM